MVYGLHSFKTILTLNHIFIALKPKHFYIKQFHISWFPYSIIQYDHYVQESNNPKAGYYFAFTTVCLGAIALFFIENRYTDFLIMFFNVKLIIIINVNNYHSLLAITILSSNIEHFQCNYYFCVLVIKIQSAALFQLNNIIHYRKSKGSRQEHICKQVFLNTFTISNTFFKEFTFLNLKVVIF